MNHIHTVWITSSLQALRSLPCVMEKTIMYLWLNPSETTVLSEEDDFGNYLGIGLHFVVYESAWLPPPLKFLYAWLISSRFISSIDPSLYINSIYIHNIWEASLWGLVGCHTLSNTARESFRQRHEIQEFAPHNIN